MGQGGVKGKRVSLDLSICNNQDKSGIEHLVSDHSTQIPRFDFSKASSARSLFIESKAASALSTCSTLMLSTGTASTSFSCPLASVQI